MMRNKHITILGLSILAAALLIVGPGWLENLGLQNDKLIDLLTFVPAMGVMFMIASARPEFIACERRAFKRLLRLK